MKRDNHLKKGLVLLVSYLLATSLLAFGIRTVTRDNTLGADFFIYYWAGRAAFTQGVDPYDTRLVLETQQAITGQLALPDQDQLAFVYPAYALFLVYPFVWLDFPTAQAIWMAANLMLLVMLPILLLPRTPLMLVLIFPLFYPLTFGVLLGNFNIPIAICLLIFLSLFVLRKERSTGLQVTAGVLLAWTLSKPQLAWLFLILALLVIFRDRLWKVMISFAVFFLGMLFLSFILFSLDWPLQWLSRARAYSGYVQAESVLASFMHVFATTQLTFFLTILIIGLLGIITVLILLNWWIQNGSNAPLPASLQKALHSNLYFPITDVQLMAWIGLITYLVHPSHTSYEQISVMIPFFFWAVTNWNNHKRMTLFFWISGLVVSWLALVIDLLKWSPVGIYALPVLFFALWLIYVMKPAHDSIVQRISSSAPA